MLLTLLALLTLRADTTMGNTCVPRFHYCLVYPAGFVAQPTSTNGDGAVMLSKDKKAEVRTYGQLQLEDDWDMNWFIGDDLKRLDIVYKVVHPKSAIFSGTDKNGNIVYQKVVLVNGEFHTIRFTYPAAQQAQYGWYCGYVAKAKMTDGESFDLTQHAH